MYRIMGIITRCGDSVSTIGCRNCGGLPVLTQKASADWLWTSGWAFVANHSQVVAVIAARQLIDRFCEPGAGDEFHPQRDFFETRDLESLSMFDRGDVIAGFEQTGLRSGVEPGHAAAEQLHLQLVFPEVKQI